MTKSELLALLRDAETVLWDALVRDISGAEETHRRIAAALRAEAMATPDGACAACGAALTQPPTGRPRKYCGGACKKRVYRAGRSA